MITVAITALEPSVKNQGNSGRMAPTENPRNELIAARQAEPGASGSTPSSRRAWVSRAKSGLADRMRATVLASSADRPRAPVHAGQLPLLPFGILGEFLPLDLHFPVDHFLLGTD